MSFKENKLVFIGSIKEIGGLLSHSKLEENSPYLKQIVTSSSHTHKNTDLD